MAGMLKSVVLGATKTNMLEVGLSGPFSWEVGRQES